VRPARDCSAGIRDDSVLIVGLGQPRIDLAVAEEPEQRVTRDEHARIHFQRERLGKCRLPGAGGTGDNEK
jgi:hypothetical protein